MTSVAKPVGTEIADRYVRNFPNLDNRTLARKMATEEPKLFTVEQARNAIRYRKGASGSKNRAGRETAGYLVPPPANNPFEFPDGEESDYSTYNIGFSKPGRALVLSDIHAPFHSLKALTKAVEDGRQSNCDTIVLNGDTADCYQISRWERDPRKRKFKDEVESVRKLLEALRRAFPDARIIWKDGNHDERLQLYLAKNAPEIFELELVGWPTLLDFRRLGIDYVTAKRRIRVGKLTVLHGHEFPNAILGPVNPARGLFLRAKDSCIAGHWHQTSEHTEPTIQDKMIATWSTGCLCDLHPSYMPLNKWNHGYAIVTVQPDGTFEVSNKRVRA